MNFSNSMKPPHKRRGTYWRDLVLGFIVGVVVALLIGLTVSRITTTANTTRTAMKASVEPAVDCLPITVPNNPTLPPGPSAAPETISLGPCRITAYCACEKCCGEWAKKRPNGVVYGAAGVELVAGVSAASPLPLGTVVEVEGLGEYVIQDCPAQWIIEKYGKNQLDIYFDNHEEACAFGLQYLNVYIKEEPK